MKCRGDFRLPSRGHRWEWGLSVPAAKHFHQFVEVPGLEHERNGEINERGSDHRHKDFAQAKQRAFMPELAGPEPGKLPGNESSESDRSQQYSEVSQEDAGTERLELP